MDFFPDRSPDELLRELEARFKTLSGKEAADGLVGMIHKRLIPVMLETAKIYKDKPCGKFSRDETGRLASLLKGWKFPSPGTRSWNEAQVTAGGVATKDVDPETLESKIVPGLFFCGEVLDVDGDSGGFNLQWAWSSGFVAGTSAASTCA
jgi:predicted Rossmann fold flavoprotein